MGIYYLRSSEIWPDKMDNLWLDAPYKKGTTVYLYENKINYLLCFYQMQGYPVFLYINVPSCKYILLSYYA